MTPLNHPGAPEQETPDWHVTAFLGPKPGEDAGPLLDAVRALRARILADHGHRPALLRADGTHADDRDLDFGAWHFIARRSPGGPPLGYIRLSTPDTGGPFQSRDFLGDEPYGELLAAEGFGAGDVFEHSRLVVEHRARKLGLGLHLNALAIGAAHHLGARAVIGTSGTRDGQDRFHERFGFRPVRGTRRYVPQYTEDVVIMLHRVADGGGRHHDLVTRLRDEFPVIAAAGAMTLLPVPPVRTARDSWHPVLCSADGLDALLASGTVREVHDPLDERLHGTWAWYPWSGRLVHVLPRAEGRPARTERRIGVLGLSADNSAALAAALQGIGGAYKLAGFGPSGRTRPRGGLPGLGVDEAVRSARRMSEVDPYLDIEIERAGLTPETIERFFAGGLDLLVEECGTPWAKIAAREYARDLGIPVVMACTDRGLLDVERFDREPDRPLLHGLLGDVKSVDLLEPPTSFDELCSGSRPHSGVALGGAWCGEAARRILLGLPCESGRFSTDLGQQLHPSRNLYAAEADFTR